jgi:hypothetical protein
MAPGDPQRLEPEFAGFVLPLDVNMRRLATVEAGEEETVRPGYFFDSRHADYRVPR